MENYETIIKNISDELLEEIKENTDEMGKVYILYHNNKAIEYCVVDIHRKRGVSTASKKTALTLNNDLKVTTNIFRPEIISYKGQKYEVLLELHLKSNFEE